MFLQGKILQTLHTPPLDKYRSVQRPQHWIQLQTSLWLWSLMLCLLWWDSWSAVNRGQIALLQLKKKVAQCPGWDISFLNATWESILGLKFVEACLHFWNSGPYILNRDACLDKWKACIMGEADCSTRQHRTSDLFVSSKLDGRLWSNLEDIGAIAPPQRLDSTFLDHLLKTTHYTHVGPSTVDLWMTK